MCCSEVVLKRTTIAVVAATLGAFALVSSVHRFVRARSTSSQNACANNLRQIEGGKEVWALENGKTKNDHPSWNDVLPYIRPGPAGGPPRCPKGGTYILGRVGDPP